MKTKLLTLLYCTALALFIISFSVGIPIYCRFFYYIQIKTLKLEAATGLTYHDIKAAYDEVLNYLTMPWFAFGTGSLAYSASGKAHFSDCKTLFNINFTVMFLSAAVLITLKILQKRKIIKIPTLKGHQAYFYSAAGVLIIFATLAAVITADFDSAFEIFHAIFFPGKTDWLFNPLQDEIILIMPERFFVNCAIIIVVSVAVFCLSLFAADWLYRRRNALITPLISLNYRNFKRRKL